MFQQRWRSLSPTESLNNSQLLNSPSGLTSNYNNLTSLKAPTGAGTVLISPEDITLPHLLHSTIKQHIDKYRKRMHPTSISMQN
jgi:hypothetical protein